MAQVQAIAAHADHPIRGILFLGMGEPLLNYDHVMSAARVLCHPAGLAISGDAFSISTAGMVPAIRFPPPRKSAFASSFRWQRPRARCAQRHFP